MFRRLAQRKIALIVGVVLAGQVLAGLFVITFVMRPQIARVANVTADTVSALSEVMGRLPPARREALIARIEQGGEIAIRRSTDAPQGGARIPNLIERQFIRSLSERLNRHGDLEWRTDRGRRLWFRLKLGGEPYWISVTPPTRRGALTGFVVSLGVAFLVAVVCGLLLQRRLDAPMRRLVRSVDAWRPDRASAPLDIAGPEEVAAVAAAFNRMTQRLERNEAERALMLGGVSHDLRTPLTRLRLCLEMMRGTDADLRATAMRQVDVIQAMLEQFLDFARGFEDEVPVRVDLARLVEDVAVTAAPEGAIATEVAPGLTACLRREALARALGNLVANALRHGGTPVSIRVREAGDGAIAFTVADAGAGFDEGAADSYLRPFARGDSARGGDGAGLGLAIVERIAAAHGGSLTFERRPDGFAAILLLRPQT
ncbi:two-component sensor histidine kinase [Novosphingobium sp. PC22D]|uniref:ATP-binding protein n=1 Tax=Novosphingobium sp. PC22D TaxID=1962403 RepID=UPI000BF1FECB|nr:ATP-binding protein [Novosphingobium sp. PC22D]PEQ10721.1 two-component sensor histidine kinase [Novosphingobium sp. PC22D]